jgi:hypothetical protein
MSRSPLAGREEFSVRRYSGDYLEDAIRKVAEDKREVVRKALSDALRPYVSSAPPRLTPEVEAEARAMALSLGPNGMALDEWPGDAEAESGE